MDQEVTIRHLVICFTGRFDSCHFWNENFFLEFWASVILKSRIYVAEVIAFSEGSIRNNAMVVEYCRTSMAALGGGTAGILGLTSLYGFAFYIFCAVAIWVRKMQDHLK